MEFADYWKEIAVIRSLWDITTTYGALSSIFQLGFGLNAVIPAIQGVFRSTHETLTDFVVSLFRIDDPSFTPTPRQRPFILEYVLRSWRGLRWLRRVGIIPKVAAIIGMVISLAGLIIGGVDPTRHISGSLAVQISLLVIIICPGLAILYGNATQLFQRLVFTRFNYNTERIRIIRKSFDICQELAGQSAELKKASELANRALARLYFSQLKRKAYSIREWLIHPVRKLMSRWRGRRVRKAIDELDH